MAVRRHIGTAAVLAVLLAGCAPVGAADETRAMDRAFALVEPSATADAWRSVAGELIERTARQLEKPASNAASAPASIGGRVGMVGFARAAVTDAGRATTVPTSAFAARDTDADATDSARGERERSVSGLGRIREFSDTDMQIEGGVLTSVNVMGFERLDVSPPAPGFTHESRTNIPVCLADGEEFVSGEWTARHDQVIDQPDGTMVSLEITIKATLVATARGGDVFDVRDIHMHVRRTDTLSNGRSVMMQGSVKGSITGVRGQEWPTRVVRALEKREMQVFTKDQWVRDEGWAYLGVAGMSIEMPHAVKTAQRAAEDAVACGWAIVPLEMSNTVINPLGNIPETRRWSGYVCGDPFTTAWHFTEERMGFRGSERIEHEIVPAENARAEFGFGVMPRIERTDALDGPGFRLSFEEKWPEGIREVAHQRAYAEVLPAVEECRAP